MSRAIETVGASQKDVVHLRRIGGSKTLCGATVSLEWFAWPLSVVPRLRHLCVLCEAGCELPLPQREN